MIKVLADMDAGAAFPTSYVSFGATGSAVFLKIGKVIVQFRNGGHTPAEKVPIRRKGPRRTGVNVCVTRASQMR